jgi:hypothetical protein
MIKKTGMEYICGAMGGYILGFGWKGNNMGLEYIRI